MESRQGDADIQEPVRKEGGKRDRKRGEGREGGRPALQGRNITYCALITESQIENIFKANFTYTYMLIPDAENFKSSLKE